MNKTKRVIIKQDIAWHFALSFVDLAETLGVYYSDRGFYELVQKMRKYIDSKIDSPTDGEIVETYVTVVQDVPITDGEN